MQKFVTFVEKNLKKALKRYKLSRVRDHCQFTDKYRGEAHSIFNLKLNVPNEMPVVFLTVQLP